jgi:hypothetical protein
MNIKASEILEVLKENSWTVEDHTTDNYQISAFNIYHLFYVFVDLKILQKGKFKYQLTQTIQNKDEQESIFSFMHFHTNDIAELVIKMGAQLEHLTKENFADYTKELSNLDIEIFADNMKGDVVRLNFN